MRILYSRSCAKQSICTSQYISFCVHWPFFVAMYRQWAVPHCSELSRDMETSIIQRNKIGRDGQYETEDEFYALVFYVHIQKFNNES